MKNCSSDPGSESVGSGLSRLSVFAAAILRRSSSTFGHPKATGRVINLDGNSVSQILQLVRYFPHTSVGALVSSSLEFVPLHALQPLQELDELGSQAYCIFVW